MGEKRTKEIGRRSRYSLTCNLSAVDQMFQLCEMFRQRTPWKHVRAVTDHPASAARGAHCSDTKKWLRLYCSMIRNCNHTRLPPLGPLLPPSCFCMAFFLLFLFFFRACSSAMHEAEANGAAKPQEQAYKRYARNRER